MQCHFMQSDHLNCVLYCTVVDRQYLSPAHWNLEQKRIVHKHSLLFWSQFQPELRGFLMLMYRHFLITGGPPLTRKSLTRFPLTRFLAYLRVSGGISISGDHSTVPLTQISCNTVFSKSQNARKVGTLCTVNQDYW